MYIGIDLGTSGVKAALVDSRHSIVAESRCPLEVSRPHDGWSEQSPDDWISAAETALDQLAGQASLEGARAIGLSGQMHGATLLDGNDRPLRPCILWNDTRASAESRKMNSAGPWRGITGNMVFPGFTAPKLMWIRENEPGIFRETRKVLLPKDYLRLWLTGESASDMSDASGTGWLDPGARNWSQRLLEESGLGLERMPRLVEGNEVSGHTRPALGRRWGLKPGILVAGGGGDNAAAAIGAGVVSPGSAFVSLGTSGVLFAACDSYRPAPEAAIHTFCHALPGIWHQMGVVLSATDSLEWLCRILQSDARSLTESLGPLSPPQPVTFLPYLGGERTPHNDSSVRGAFIGIEHATGRKSLVKAVLEGVAFAVRDCYDALAQAGAGIHELMAVGGGSQSTCWLEAIATLLGKPIDVPKSGDFGAAFGAARLAHMADSGQGAELARKPETAFTVEPVQGLADAYSEAHQRYRKAYLAIRGI